jgi:hypothetical protein
MVHHLERQIGHRHLVDRLAGLGHRLGFDSRLVADRDAARRQHQPPIPVGRLGHLEGLALHMRIDRENFGRNALPAQMLRLDIEDQRGVLRYGVDQL